MISYFFFNYIHLILIHCLSTCFCNQHPVNLLLHCFLCIFIEMITDNIDCLPDFLCKCVTLCFCIHHFFHNHFSFLLEPQQRVIPLVSVRTLFFKSDPKWALPVSQALQFIYDNIMYAELNTKSDYCQCCGYDGEIKIVEDDGKLVWECPKCGNRDQNKLNVARRTCGYIGTQFWNQGRTQEIKDRVLHL